MHSAAVGFRVHSGWTAAVAVALTDNLPVVLCRKRIELVKTFTFTFRQPYHTAGKMPLAEAKKFVGGVKTEANRLAVAGMVGIEKDLASSDYQVTTCALLMASGRSLPPLEKILASHAMIHTADGELFRDSIVHACERRGLVVTKLKERGVLDQGAAKLRLELEVLQRTLRELGRSFGAPWSQDEKLATLAAWLCLDPRIRSGSREGSRRTT
jgi:hypothetical protein